MYYRVSCLLAVLCAIVSGCSHVAEQELLSFPVSEENDRSQAEVVFPEKITGALNLLGFAVRGNELIVTSDFMADYCLDVIDLTSGETVRQLCRKGRGPGEFLSISPFFSLESETVTVYDYPSRTLSDVSLSGEIIGSAIHRVELEATPKRGQPIIQSSYKVFDTQLLAYNSIQGSAEFVSIDTPYYALYDLESGAEKRQFTLFASSPMDDYSEDVRMNAFSLVDCINPQKTSLCFALSSMPVYGFLDIRTGKVKGFRIKGAPSFSATELQMCFTGICAQNDCIYALYFGRPAKEHMPGVNTYLYKFDWNGRILGKYELDGLFRSCYATPDALYLSKVEDNQTLCLYRLETRNGFTK